MSKRPGWKPACYSIFEPIVDMDALDADLMEFLARERHAPTTRIMYDYLWAQWEGFCKERGFEPLGAPPEAILALVGASARGTLRRKSKGRKLTGEPSPFSPSHLDCWLAAIKDAHTRENLVVTWAEAPHADVLRKVRAGYRRWHGSAGGQEATPLTPDGARQMLPLGLPWTAEDCRRRAAVLIALDLAVPVVVLAAVTSEDAGITAGHVVLRLPDQEGSEAHGDSSDPFVIMCTAVESQTISEPCGHCAVVDLLNCSPPSGRALFADEAATPEEAYRELDLLMDRAARNWQGLSYREGVLAYDPPSSGAPPWLRHALALDQQKQGLAHLRARSMVLLGWHVGLSSSDARWLLRRDTMVDRDRITGFRRTSGQPTSERSVGFVLTPSVERQLCAFSAVREWMGVRDLATGAGGQAQPLFCHLGRGNGLKPDRPTTNGCSSWFMWRDLQERAGMDRVYSPASSRTGYTQIALAAGASTYVVQASLNQKKPDHVASRARALRQRAGSAQRTLLDGPIRGEDQ